MIWFLIQKKIRYVIFLNNGEVPSIEWEAVLKTVGDKTFAGAKPVLSAFLILLQVFINTYEMKNLK